MSNNLKVQFEGLKIDEINKLHFNSFIEPQVSIIIPVFNNWKYTYCCLNSILEHTEEVTYEVIVVDDGSSDETVEMLEKVQNIRIILNESNLGYLKACNRGAEVAKGQYLLFLNNDTEPQEGWLENLLSIADGDKVIGAVGAKLIYPDGKLQEAGGMIFSDGRPWKFGNGDDPEKEIYNQICEVDYCSGACLLVRKSLFTELGGFDVRYVPAYYEDADLCFTLRKMGYKVLYSPEVVVIHYEAVTAGKNAYSWGEINRMKFIEKWENEVTYQDEHPSITGEFPATANRERLTKIPTFENKLKFLKNIYKLLNALTEERDTWIRAHSVSEADRAARLEVIERQAKEFSEKTAELEADRAARLEIIERQAKEFSEKAAEFEADQAARLELINSLSERLQASEADRAARLEIIERQAKEFSEKTAELKSSMSWKITAPFRRILDKWNTIKERFSSKIPAEFVRKSMSDYVYQPEKREEDFEKCVQLLQKEYDVFIGHVNHTAPQVITAIHDDFKKYDIPVNEWYVNAEEYNEYFEKAAYEDLYPNYYKDYLPEKSFEHFVAFRLLDIHQNEVFIDIASENSPIPEIFSRLTGCKSYRQDIMYPPGINGDQIGGDACQMLVPNQFAHKVALTCSLEHFEGERDQRLFIELSRVLKPGGKVCVVPLYTYTSAANQIDPAVSIPNSIPLDKNATIYCAKKWGNRFDRFYSPASFVERIFNPAKDFLSFEVFRIMNADEVHHDIYARFALVVTKK